MALGREEKGCAKTPSPRRFGLTLVLRKPLGNPLPPRDFFVYKEHLRVPVWMNAVLHNEPVYFGVQPVELNVRASTFTYAPGSAPKHQILSNYEHAKLFHIRRDRIPSVSVSYSYPIPTLGRKLVYYSYPFGFFVYEEVRVFNKGSPRYVC